MHEGFIGPLPILHWFFLADGEDSYNLIEYEMFILLVIFYIAAQGIKHFTSRFFRKETINNGIL